MATSKEYIEFVCKQLQGINGVTYKKMFGEYMVYVQGKPLLLVCDNTVMIKKLPELAALMQGAPEVLIQTPYAICSREMYADLEALRQAGGQISVLTNSVQTGANLFGCVDYLNQKQTLLQHGLTLYEYAGERSSHTKTVLIGDRLSVVGSFNLDMRSAYLDTELMLAVDCPALNAQLRAAAAQLQAASLCVQPDGTATAGPLYAPPALPLGRRLLYAVMRVVSRPIRFLL